MFKFPPRDQAREIMIHVVRIVSLTCIMHHNLIILSKYLQVVSRIIIYVVNIKFTTVTSVILKKLIVINLLCLDCLGIYFQKTCLSI